MATFLKASLISLRQIEISLYTKRKVPARGTFTLFVEGEKYGQFKVEKKTHADSFFYTCILTLNEDYQFGKRYEISYSDYPYAIVDTYEASSFPEFDDLFYYDGEDLGSHYKRGETSFAMWAPTATNVILKIENHTGRFVQYKMERSDKGVYRLLLEGDYKNRRYCYYVENSGVYRKARDIYAKETSLRSEYSVVIDEEELARPVKPIKKDKFVNPVDAIIYETHIRDFTEDKSTDIVHKGKYLGMVEKGRRTEGGHPAGLDYLKHLGITHLQVLPVLDYYNVDDVNVEKKYNWGYDPISFFALEGSLATHPETPLNRIDEFKAMVSGMHEAGIRVNLDVVYNHLFDHHTTDLERTVPGYYFRKNKDGSISSVSGCGNDIASERKMTSRLIVDSLVYLAKTFDLDGFRFDLMGLIDSDTLLEAEKRLRAFKPNIMLYGEGWNMPNQLPVEKKGVIENARNMPGYGFFNDVYRDVLKGSTFDLKQKGYVNGDFSYGFGLEYIFRGSCVNVSYDARFVSANQSINYVECHDNNTLFDKLSVSNEEEDEDTILKRVQLANKIVLLSFGVPFIHMGQEIGLSKEGHPNTYKDVKINNMDWSLVDERYHMVDIFVSFVQYRRNLHYTSLYKPEDIAGVFKGERDDEHGVIHFTCEDSKYIYPFKKLLIAINPTDKIHYFEADDYLILLGVQSDGVYHKNIINPAIEATILYKI